jgi:NADH-quinone oxidoreductase subunit I
MRVTMLNFVRPKVTEQYPENRGRHVYFERFRAELTMPHDADNRHRCTACGICQMNCPNGTITVVSRAENDPATGRERRILDRHLWDSGSCTFCALCARSCPQDAIEFSNRFEHSVFTRSLLVEQLNRPGSRLVEKAVAPVEQTNTVQ